MPFTNNNGVPDAGFMIAKLVYDIGDVLVADDYHDYGKFDHIHHWFVGEIFRQLGKHLGGALVGLSIAEEFKNNVVEKVFPLTTDDEAKLNSIIQSCLKATKSCHT